MKLTINPKRLFDGGGETGGKLEGTVNVGKLVGFGICCAMVGGAGALPKIKVGELHWSCKNRFYISSYIKY